MPRLTWIRLRIDAGATMMALFIHQSFRPFSPRLPPLVLLGWDGSGVLASTASRSSSPAPTSSPPCGPVRLFSRLERTGCPQQRRLIAARRRETSTAVAATRARWVRVMAPSRSLCETDVQTCLRRRASMVPRTPTIRGVRRHRRMVEYEVDSDPNGQSLRTRREGGCRR